MKPRDIVALSRWQFPYSLSEEQKAEKEKLRKDSPAKPEGFDKELEIELSAAVDKFQEEWVDDSKHFGKSQTSPTHWYTLELESKKKSHTTDRQFVCASPSRSRGVARPSAARSGFFACSRRP